MQIKGDYLQLRKFLSQSPTDLHCLVLDCVEFHRQKINDTVLEAQVKMTLFLFEN